MEPGAEVSWVLHSYILHRVGIARQVAVTGYYERPVPPTSLNITQASYLQLGSNEINE